MHISRFSAKVSDIDTKKRIVELSDDAEEWSKRYLYANAVEQKLKDAIREDNTVSVVIETSEVGDGPDTVTILTIADIK